MIAPRHPPILSLQDVDIRWGSKVALSHCTLALLPGERLALLGPNGAGKTTLLRAGISLCPVASGQVTIGTAKVGSMLEHPGIGRQSTSLEYLLYHGRLQGLGNPRRRALDLLEEWELPNTACRTLSLGQRSRLQIARSLIHCPSLLLLDEPAANLDPQARHDLHLRLREWNSQGGTLLWTTHDLEEAIAEASTIAVLSDGSMRWIGKAQDFTKDFPSSLVVKFDNFCPTSRIRSALDEQDLLEGEGLEARIRTRTPPSRTLRSLMDAGLAVQSFGPDRQSLFEGYRDALQAPALASTPCAPADAMSSPITITPFQTALAATLRWEAGNLRRELRFFLPFAVMQSLLVALQVLSDIQTPASLTLLPVSLCASLCADSIAGERERLGLETLRATHAPIGAILLGKATIAWWGGLLPGLGSLSVACMFTDLEFLPWAASMTGTTLACTAFAARVAAGAPTVRSAAQMSVLGSFFTGVALVVLSVVLPHGLGAVKMLVPVGLGLASLGLLDSARRTWDRL